MQRDTQNTADAVKYSQELLAKVEGIKAYVKRLRQVGQISSEEYIGLSRPLTQLEAVSRNIVLDRERQHDRAGGSFANQISQPKFYTR